MERKKVEGLPLSPLYISRKVLGPQAPGMAGWGQHPQAKGPPGRQRWGVWQSGGPPSSIRGACEQLIHIYMLPEPSLAGLPNVGSLVGNTGLGLAGHAASQTLLGTGWLRISQMPRRCVVHIELRQTLPYQTLWVIFRKSSLVGERWPREPCGPGLRV